MRVSYAELGGGMNLIHRKILNLMGAIDPGEVVTPVIAHNDRLARFGFTRWRKTLREELAGEVAG